MAGVVSGQDFNDKTISEVQIRFRGPKTVDEARLRNFMSVRAGDKFNNEVLDADIKKLYESGLVDDVRFLAEPAGERLKLVCEVVTRPSVPGIGFVGNTLYSDAKLARVTKLKAGKPISDADILEARRNIEDHYRGYGYPEVRVGHEMQATAREGWSDLIFIVEEGVRSEVRKIRFEGNNAFADVELRREMETKQKGLFSFITKSGRIDPIELERDKDRVLAFYRNEGHMRAAITETRKVAVKDGRVDLVFTIYEGPVYKVGSISFGKMTVFTSEELSPGLSMIAGDRYSAKKLADDRRMIRSYYGSRGYADATIQADSKSSDDAAVVHLVYRVTEGRPYRVGRVNIQGNVKTKDKVIRREVPMKPGDSFNSVDLDATRKRLENLGYFGSVQVNGTPSSQTGYRDLNILVQEKRTGSVSVGAGFSSIDSIVGYINLEQTNFDIRNPWNFTGGGQRFSMQLKLGSERKDFKVSLIEPWFMGRRLSLGGDLYFRELLYLSDQYDQMDVGASVFLRSKLGRKGYIKGSYTLEEIDIDASDADDPDGKFAEEDGTYTRSALDFEYTYDGRDSNTTPREGGRFKFGTTLSGGVLGGDVDTYKISTSGSYHWQLPWDMIMNVNGSANVVDGLSGDDDVPIFERLFLGGSRDLRGFDFRDIGGERENGDVLGGQSSVFASLELTVPLVENVRGAAFYDVGSVADDSWDFSFDKLYSDAGLGLRLNLPIGPLALDYAVPIQSDDDDADNGGKFNFYLNYQF